MAAKKEPTWGPQYKRNVMFLCNHNSCRSQMADGLLRSLRSNRSVGVASAGIVGGTAVKPGAITVMKEVGIDISEYSSDAMADFYPTDFDVVISCCGCGSKLDGDNEVWKKRGRFVDWNLDDPPAIDPGDLSAYRRVRDEAKELVVKLLDELAPKEPTWGAKYKKNVMFLCNHNSCRSQMADGWLQSLRGDRSVGVASAGIVGGTAVKPGAITVMKEVGVDISGYSSDAMADFSPDDFDAVISCCGCGSKLDGDKEAWKQRPKFEDWNLDDPPAIDPDDLSAYRRVRDEAKDRVVKLLDELEPQTGIWEILDELVHVDRFTLLKIIFMAGLVLFCIACVLVGNEISRGRFDLAAFYGGFILLVVGLLGSVIFVIVETKRIGNLPAEPDKKSD